MGTQSVDEYCREIETYLCRKNDGHLIRVVGPSFDVVTGWASSGVPLKVALSGIDRYFERYYKKGSRRHPVKIDFCDADVQDVFDEWRRALGLPSGGRASSAPTSTEDGGCVGAELARPPSATSRSLPAHLERALLRLTEARASGKLGSDFDALLDRVSSELDTARAKSQGVRGAARQSLIERLAVLDADLMAQARASIDDGARSAFTAEAEEELMSFRAAMAQDAYARARAAAVDRLIRERLGLPTIVFI